MQHKSGDETVAATSAILGKRGDGCGEGLLAVPRLGYMPQWKADRRAGTTQVRDNHRVRKRRHYGHCRRSVLWWASSKTDTPSPQASKKIRRQGHNASAYARPSSTRLASRPRCACASWAARVPVLPQVGGLRPAQCQEQALSWTGVHGSFGTAYPGLTSSRGEGLVSVRKCLCHALSWYIADRRVVGPSPTRRPRREHVRY
jgi:hypothetical protein